MRNDLAITQYHLRDFDGCRRTLEPLREDAEKTDEELKSQYPVFALDASLASIHAARTNLKLCRDSQQSRNSAEVPELLRLALQIIKHDTKVPVLLPSMLPAGSGSRYASAASTKSGWNIRIESLPDCMGANTCFVGYISGERRVFPSRAANAVPLTNGIKGQYSGRSCGGSCAPPQIEWAYHGILYAIQYNLDGNEKEVKDQLIALANSAILGGER